MTTKLKVLACGLGIAALFALPTFAADANGEIMKAATHAGLAAKATDIKTVQTHLHHVVNCLEGPSGKDFDKSQLNPCAKDGNGAIPDTTDSGAKKSLDAALAKAKAGLAATELKAAQSDATATANDLKKIK